jgi:hypothetical protein
MANPDRRLNKGPDTKTAIDNSITMAKMAKIEIEDIRY